MLRLYHGTTKPLDKPFYGGGIGHHDYGNGFYCSEDIEAAKEWACQHADVSMAYVYTYDLDMTGLSLLDMNTLEPIYWLSSLAQYRYGRAETKAREARRLAFIKLFPINCELYEVIGGWRADDRYFVYLNLFLNSDISYEAVVQAIKLGDVGQQVVLKGRKSYTQIRQIGDKLIVSREDYTEYSAQYIEREARANAKLDEVRDIPGRLLTEIMANGGL